MTVVCIFHRVLEIRESKDEHTVKLVCVIVVVDKEDSELFDAEV